MARDVNALEFPTAPDNVTVPPDPPFKIRGEPPLTVLEKVIFAPAGAPLVVSAVTAAAKETGPFIDRTEPLVVTLPPKLISVPL